MADAEAEPVAEDQPDEAGALDPRDRASAHRHGPGGVLVLERAGDSRGRDLIGQSAAALAERVSQAAEEAGLRDLLLDRFGVTEECAPRGHAEDDIRRR